MIRVEIKGLQELNVRIAAMNKRTQEIEPALKLAGAAVLESAKRRIDEGGGEVAWTPNIARSPLLHSVEGSGHLYSSLTMGASGNVADLSGSTIRVGTNVFYARWMQEGTGIYGDRGTPIIPLQTVSTGMYGESYNLKIRKNVSSDKTYHAKLGDASKESSVLAFKIGGKMCFFKSVKGSPKRPYLYVNEDDSQVVGRIFGKYIIGDDQLEA